MAHEAKQDGTYYSAHAHPLQTFAKKVSIFRAITECKDHAIASGAAPQTFKPSPLYDRYFEYAEILSAQGLMKEAACFLELTPQGYKGRCPAQTWSRLVAVTSRGPVAAAATSGARLPGPAVAATRSVYARCTRSMQPVSHQQQSVAYQPYDAQPSVARNAPTTVRVSRPPPALNLNKPAAITSPLPNAAPSPADSPQGPPYTAQDSAAPRAVHPTCAPAAAVNHPTAVAHDVAPAVADTPAAAAPPDAEPVRTAARSWVR